MSYHKGFIAPLLLALIALLVLGGGAYVYLQKKQENPPVTGNVALPQATSTIPTTNQTTSTMQTPNSQTDETSSWPVHQNARNKLEIKYPSNFLQILDSYNSFSLGSTSDTRLPEISLGGEKEYTNCKVAVSEPGIESRQMVLINNESYCLVSREDYSMGHGVQSVTYIVKGVTAYASIHFDIAYAGTCPGKNNNGPSYVCENSYNETAAKELLEKVVSTFKFNP